jgi:hypothetical protein
MYLVCISLSLGVIDHGCHWGRDVIESGVSLIRVCHRVRGVIIRMPLNWGIGEPCKGVIEPGASLSQGANKSGVFLSQVSRV